jgi:ketol-acid reductoisomerase
MKKNIKNLSGVIIGCGSIGKRHLNNLKILGLLIMMKKY